MKYLLPFLAALYLLANIDRLIGAEPPKLTQPQQAEWDKAVKAALFAENTRLTTKEAWERKHAELQQAENKAKREALEVAAKILKELKAAKGCDLSIEGTVVCPAETPPAAK